MFQTIKNTTSLVTVTVVAVSFVTYADADDNALTIRQIGDSNTAKVIQGHASNIEYNVDFPEQAFPQPTLSVMTPAGNVVQKAVPVDPQACVSSGEISCVSIPGIVDVPDGEAVNSRARIVQHGSSNMATTRQYGNGSKLVIVQGTVDSLKAMSDPGGISDETRFDFTEPGKTVEMFPVVGAFDNGREKGLGLESDFESESDESEETESVNQLTGSETLDDILATVGGERGSENYARVIQGGGSNRSVALQTGSGNRLLTVQDGGDTAVHIQTNGGNNTQLLQGAGSNTNALVARGGVSAPSGPFTLRAQGGANLALDLRGSQNYSGVFAKGNGTGGMNIRFRR